MNNCNYNYNCNGIPYGTTQDPMGANGFAQAYDNMTQHHMGCTSKIALQEFIVNYLANQGLTVSKVTKLPEEPNGVLRHSCVYTGIICLSQSFLSVIYKGVPLNLGYYYCNKCGVLYYCDPDFYI